jgi:hypothetical protein
MNLYRRWRIARGYKKLAKQLAKDPQYKALRDAVIERRKRQNDSA